MLIMLTHLINQYGDRIAVETRNLEKVLAPIINWTLIGT